MKVNIKQAARKKGWSLYRLAKEMDITNQTVYSWASGRTFPRPEYLDLICATLKCKIGDILEVECPA